MTKERWLPIVGYEGLYEVSDLGRVRGLDRMIRHPRGGLRRWPGKLLVNWPLRHGYVSVYLCREGGLESRTVHSLVLEAFRGLRPLGHESAHRNGRRADNRLRNLLWKTRKDNHADKIRHGTTNRGERHGLAKLTNAKVRLARRLRTHGLTHDAIAAQTGVSRSNISRVLRGEMWAHV